MATTEAVGNPLPIPLLFPITSDPCDGVREHGRRFGLRCCLCFAWFAIGAVGAGPNSSPVDVDPYGGATVKFPDEEVDERWKTSR